MELTISDESNIENHTVRFNGREIENYSIYQMQSMKRCLHNALEVIDKYVKQ